MSDVWSGTFTFLLTDIEGSTRLWEEAPGDMARALTRHDELIERIILTRGGRLVRSRGEGDSAFAVFEDAADAMAGALELQRAIQLEPWPASAPIRVRMALHTGPAQARRDDFFGPGVNRAARLRSAAHGGQVLISAETQRNVASSLPDGVWLTDLGLHRLRDLARPEHIWQVGHAELPSDFPPIRSLDARGHNLPVQLTAFVGREMDLLDVRKRLEMSPMLTLTGPGGIGKTRLALQAAAESSEDFADGVWLVELTSVTDGDLVPTAIAAALGVREEPGRELLQSLVEHLAPLNALIVIDNCEHLVAACAKVVHELLQSAEALHVLATTREPLRVYGEAIYAVQPLDVPSDATSYPEEAMESEAVRLFVDRAELADRGFSIGEETDAVVSICRRLEGIPLAIELAASLVRSMPPRLIAERLHDRLAALAEGPRTAPARQQTLRAAIDWSYELLGPKEQVLFERLSVFAGGFTLDAASAVAADEGTDPAEIVSLLTSLADRSLLVVREPGEARYGMLDTLREYGMWRATLRGELNMTMARFVSWAAALAQESGQTMRGLQAGEALATIEVEHDNIRAATARAIEQGDEVLASQLVCAVFYFWFVRAHFREGRTWLGRTLEAFPDSPRRATMLLHNAQLANSQGDVATALPQLEEAVTLARETNDRPTLGIGLNSLATVALQAGRGEDTKRYASEALTVLRIEGMPQGVAQALNVLGIAAALEGDEQSAYNYYADALAISREMGMTENVARLLMNLGNMSLARSDYERAREYYEECRETALAIGDTQTASGALSNLGVIAKTANDHERARSLLSEALVEKRRIGDGRGIIVALQGLADVDRRELRFAGTRAALAEAFELCLEFPYALGIIQGLETLAAVCADEATGTREALRFAAAAEAARSATNIKRNSEDVAEFDRAVAALRTQVDRDDAQTAWDEGTKLTAEQAARAAIDFARGSQGITA